MKTITILACLCVMFTSCSKPANDEDVVAIRVKNETTSKIIDVKVYSLEQRNNVNAEKRYGTIEGQAASNYINYNSISEIPVLSYKIDGAGTIDINRVRCASPAPANLPAGKYTLHISGDHINPDVSFVKD